MALEKGWKTQGNFFSFFVITLFNHCQLKALQWGWVRMWWTLAVEMHR